MTTAQAMKLTAYVAAHHKFLPSIAEVIEDWQHLAKEERNRSWQQQNYERKQEPIDEAMRERIRQIQENAQKKTPTRPDLTEDLVAFARRHFPAITTEQIEANWLDISYCQRENEKEIRTKSAYRTVMELTPDGTIEILMRKLA